MELRHPFISPDGTSDYTYDDTSQLTAATHTYQTDESYSYDANGNRTNSGYTTGTNNRLTSDGTYNYTYDDEGNRTKKTEISSGDYVDYTWDHNNRLTAITFKDSLNVTTKKVEYDYDLFDRRIAKRVDENGNGTFDSEQHFVYDGFDVVLVYDGTSSLTNRYLHGPAVDQLFADEDALGDVLWSLPDNQGTVRDQLDTDGVAVNHLKYDAFGNITAQSDPTIEVLFAYTGREWDADAELYYYRARWYDPVVGRFISEDPIGFASGDTNLSRYVSNNSPNAVDPSGLEEHDLGMAADVDASVDADDDPFNLWSDMDAQKYEEWYFLMYSDPRNTTVAVLRDLGRLYTEDEQKLIDFCNNNTQCINEVVEFLEVLQDVEMTSRWGDDPCGNFCSQFMTEVRTHFPTTVQLFDGRYIASDYFNNITWQQQYYHVLPGIPITPGNVDYHTVIQLTLTNGNTTLEVYLDVGNHLGGYWAGSLGGDDHIFFDDSFTDRYVITGDDGSDFPSRIEYEHLMLHWEIDNNINPPDLKFITRMLEAGIL